MKVDKTHKLETQYQHIASVDLLECSRSGYSDQLFLHRKQAVHDGEATKQWL